MQKSIFILCLLVLSLSACQNEGGTKKQAAVSTPEAQAVNTGKTSATDKTGETGLNKQPFKSPDSPQLERIKRVLSTNFWVNTAYFKMDDKNANRDNQGNWYQFNPDGNFTFGHFEKELAKGKWTFEYKDGKVGQIHLQADNTDYSGKWSIKMGSDEDLMIWVGTEVYNTNGVQQRFENLLFIPKNRKELGMD